MSFWFEGRPLVGTAGDSIAKALFANGIRTLSHSVKYHRPRSVSCGRGRCSMCAVAVDGVPGVKACTTPLAAGMTVRRQDSRPWYAPALTAAARLIPFPAGFYYRYFTRPRPLRDAFLGSLRAMAGVGRIDTSTPPPPARAVRADAAGIGERYDVLVVGAGVSGMAAALSAAGTGADVAIVDEHAHLGGHALGALHDPTAVRARDDLVAATRGGAVTVALGSTVQALYADHRLLVSSGTSARQRRIRAPHVILATGALDAIPLFANNDLPGIFGARGLRLLLERDRMVLGSRAVVFGSGREADDVVALLRAHGVAVARRIEDGAIVSAQGRAWVKAVSVERSGRLETVSCDLLCVATRGQPDFALAQQAGFSFALEAGPVALMLPTSERAARDGQTVYLVGETGGVVGCLEKIEHAARVGREAGTAAGRES